MIKNFFPTTPTKYFYSTTSTEKVNVTVHRRGNNPLPQCKIEYSNSRVKLSRLPG